MTGASLALASATSGPSALWYATRATGAVALVLLTAAVALGVAGSVRFASPRWPRIVTSGLHRNLSLLAVCFLAVHIVTALADPFAPLGWYSALIPFLSAYRPVWLGLGTVAFDLVLALVLTSLARARIGRRAWRAVHWLAYAAWPAALWHGLGAGTDARSPLMLGIDAVCALAVAAAAWRRLVAAADPAQRLAGVAAVAAVPLATAVFAVAGPLRPGWALRAGTPAALLAHPAPPQVRGGGTGPPRGGAIAGTLSRTGGGGLETVVVRASTAGSARERVLITLRGAASAGGGVALSSGRVSLTAPGGRLVYVGPVTSLHGDVVAADLAGPGGSAARALITLVIRGSRVRGELSVSSGGGGGS